MWNNKWVHACTGAVCSLSLWLKGGLYQTCVCADVQSCVCVFCQCSVTLSMRSAVRRKCRGVDGLILVWNWISVRNPLCCSSSGSQHSVWSSHKFVPNKQTSETCDSGFSKFCAPCYVYVIVDKCSCEWCRTSWGQTYRIWAAWYDVRAVLIFVTKVCKCYVICF